VRRHLLTFAAIAASAGLVVAVVVVAVSSASGTPGGTALGGPSPRAVVRVRQLPVPTCVFQGGRGPSAVSVSGECSGELKGEFRCVKSGDGMSVSIRRLLSEGNVFYLTFLVPDYRRPGRYPETEAVIQIIGPPNPPRWSVREAIAEEAISIVRADGSVELGTFAFEPEPGTPAMSAMLLQGHATCAVADRGLMRKRKR
jgi:hypothetical protein